jgi:hypothetical protein
VVGLGIGHRVCSLSRQEVPVSHAAYL